MKEQRKLTAIMFTDIVGYTALMAKDEQKALRILHKNRDIQKPLIKKYNGEWLKEMGDGTLSSFSSVVDAVNCALEIQHSLKDDPELSLRIAIHIGDVVVEEGDVFGDGVNVASRIEPLAEPGGICVSHQVYINIRNKPDIKAVFLGEKTLKNVEEPVKVYSLKKAEVPAAVTPSIPSEEIEDVKKKFRKIWITLAIMGILIIVGYAVFTRFVLKPTTIPITEEIKKEIKSIAVLPFVNMSADPEQEYFCDGMADAILNALTHVEGLRVIARTSAFTFRGKEKNIREIGEALNVETVLEGSIQKADNRVRITAQLIKVADESHLFSDIYDRELKDVFAIQDEISMAIVKALKVKLLGKEKAAIEKRPTENLEAYNLYLLGHHNLEKGDREKALEIDDTLAEAYIAMAWVRIYSDWDWPAAEQLSKRALELNPGSHTAHNSYGHYLWLMGRLEEALSEYKRALELDPIPIQNYSLAMLLNIGLGRYDEAMDAYHKGTEIDPKYLNLHRNLGRLNLKQGNYKEAI